MSGLVSPWLVIAATLLAGVCGYFASNYLRKRYPRVHLLSLVVLILLGAVFLYWG